MKAFKIVVLLILMFPATILAQEIINLYPGEIPNFKKSYLKESFTSGMFRNVTKPTLEIYLPAKDKATGAAVVICPGGGYSVIVYQGEGISTAKEFAKNGIAAFVLKYRIPDDLTMADKKTGPLQDAQQAIKVVRENASKWGIEPNKIGIMGFSAGSYSDITTPTLSSVDQHGYKMGVKAATVLLKRIETQSIGHGETFYIDTNLVIRESTKKI